jgi:hypothetical protein
MIQNGVDFALSQDGVTGLCTTGDIEILPMFLDACEDFTPMDKAEQEELISNVGAYEGATIFE